MSRIPSEPHDTSSPMRLAAIIEAVEEARRTARGALSERLADACATLERLDRDAHVLRDLLTAVSLYSAQLGRLPASDETALLLSRLDTTLVRLREHAEGMFPRPALPRRPREE